MSRVSCAQYWNNLLNLKQTHHNFYAFCNCNSVVCQKRQLVIRHAFTDSELINLSYHDVWRTDGPTFLHSCHPKNMINMPVDMLFTSVLLAQASPAPAEEDEERTTRRNAPPRTNAHHGSCVAMQRWLVIDLRPRKQRWKFIINFKLHI